MLRLAEFRPADLSHRVLAQVRARRTAQDHWLQLASNAILVLGAPRSGTTWLAKIFDSHPDVLYRHEPDEASPPDISLDAAAQIAAWLRQRGLRTAGKRPDFAKSWRPASRSVARTTVRVMLSIAGKLPLVDRVAAHVPLPDLVAASGRDHVRAAVKLVNWDGIAASRTMPGARCIFILRHPCGQVASVLAGRAARLLDGGKGRRPAGQHLASAQACAACHGVDAATFARLPEAGRLAWAWRAFNEPALLGFRDRPNARIVRYEDICYNPEPAARDLFAFAGLPWHPQTAAFLHDSTRQDRGGYFDVFRAGTGVAEKWRQTMDPLDQAAVRSVVAGSDLAMYWSDLR